MLNPLLFYLLRRYESRLERFEKTASPDADPLMTPVAFDLRDHVIVVGYGRVGRRLAEELHRAKTPFLVIEPKRDRVDMLEGNGVRAIFGNADRPEILLAAGVRQARALLVAMPQAFDAAQVIKEARRLNPALSIIARASFEAEADYLRESGAHTVLVAEQELADRMIASLPAGPSAPAGAAYGSSSVSQ